MNDIKGAMRKSKILKIIKKIEKIQKNVWHRKSPKTFDKMETNNHRRNTNEVANNRVFVNISQKIDAKAIKGYKKRERKEKEIAWSDKLNPHNIVDKTAKPENIWMIAGTIHDEALRTDETFSIGREDKFFARKSKSTKTFGNWNENRSYYSHIISLKISQAFWKMRTQPV